MGYPGVERKKRLEALLDGKEQREGLLDVFVNALAVHTDDETWDKALASVQTADDMLRQAREGSH